MQEAGHDTKSMLWSILFTVLQKFPDLVVSPVSQVSWGLLHITDPFLLFSCQLHNSDTPTR